MPPGPWTWTGTGDWVLVLLPSCPSELSPQHQMVPSVLTAQVVLSPAVIEMTPVRVPVPPGPLTWTGVELTSVGGVVAELAFVVAAPAPHGAIGLDRTRVRVTGSQGDGVVEHSGPARPLDLDGCHPVGGGVVAELALGVDAPAPGGVVGQGSAGEELAGSDAEGGTEGSGAAGADDLDGCRSVGGGVVAELAFGVVAPAPGGAVGLGGAGVFLAGSEVGDGGEGSGAAGSVDLDGGELVGGGVVAELAFVVAAPAPGGAVGLGGADVGFAGGGGGDGGEGSDAAGALDLDRHR